MISMTRIYGTGQQASEAVDKLQEAGFARDKILVVTPENSGADSLGNAIKLGRALGNNSLNAVTDAVNQGQSVVVCQVQFGRGMAACDIMDGCNPIKTDELLEVSEHHRGAPFSSAMGWPVLSLHSPMPLSTLLGMETKTESRGIFSGFFKELSSGFSFGTPKLSNNAAPLSGKFGLGLLRKGPGDTSFGRPLLSDNATPLSSKIGFDTLSDNPTPLSSKLGMPTLQSEKH